MKPADNSNPTDFSRRNLMAGAAAGLVSLAITPRLGNPQTQEVLEQLTTQRGTLAAFAETLLPGATEAGIESYVETQLASRNPLLFVRYLDYPEGLLSFYRRGLKALDDLSESRHGHLFAALNSEQKSSLARELSQKTPPGWTGPPAPLFYLAVRNDAVDVYYGTQRGFEKLGVPYMALISPPEPW